MAWCSGPRPTAAIISSGSRRRMRRSSPISTGARRGSPPRPAPPRNGSGVRSPKSRRGTTSTIPRRSPNWCATVRPTRKPRRQPPRGSGATSSPGGSQLGIRSPHGAKRNAGPKSPDFRPLSRASIRATNSPLRPPHHVHQLGDLAPLIGLVARGDRVLDAMGDVVAQDFLLGAAQRRAYRRDLRDDVDAVAVVFDHAGEPPHLPLDALQALEARRLDVLAHGGYIPPTGIRCKGRAVTHVHAHCGHAPTSARDPVC